MKVKWVPATRSGWIGLCGCAGFFLMLALFFLLNAVVPDNGAEGFFAQPHLALPLLAAWASATAGLGFGAYAVFVKRDLAVLTFCNLILGVFVEFWAIAELLGE